MLLHDRLEAEWHFVGSAADWMHLVLLELDSVYDPFLSTFLFCVRTLIDINRDLLASSSSESGDHADTIDTITRLLPMIGRPLKRLGEILAIVSDAQVRRTEQFFFSFDALFSSLSDMLMRRTCAASWREARSCFSC